jgi:hypothetical protein
MAQRRRAGSAQSKVATTTVRIPEDVHGRVRVIAGVTGSTPGAVLSTAFEEYLENHRDDFANHFELVQKVVFSGSSPRRLEGDRRS